MNERDGALAVPVALASGAIAVAFVPVTLATKSEASGVPIAAVNAAIGATQLALGILAWRFTRLRGSTLLASTTLLSLANTLSTLAIARDPAETMYLSMLVVAAGAIMLSGWWLGIVIAASLGGWLAIARGAGFAGWETQGVILAVSGAVSVLVQTLRRRALARDQMLQAATRESEERYRGLVENAPDAILVARDDKWIFVNDAAVRLFGAQSRDELLASDTSIRLVDHGAEKLGIRIDGLTVPVEVTDLPIRWDGEAAVQRIVRDVSARQAAEAERREIERLRELDAVKTRFLNSVSHELRTPLTPIRVQLHILRQPTASAEAKQRAMAIVDRNVARMAGLIEDLLEVARVEGGRLQVDHVPLDLRDVLAEAKETFDAPAQHANVAFTMRAEGSLPVLGDARRITQVLYNLLGNALKFTPAGGRIDVDARVEGNEVVVSVADTGAGISPDDIPRLFEPFSQAHDPMQKTNAGTGLGLYISRGLVEAHGGSIACESEGHGHGSRFTFKLPLAAAQPGNREAQKVEP